MALSNHDNQDDFDDKEEFTELLELESPFIEYRDRLLLAPFFRQHDFDSWVARTSLDNAVALNNHIHMRDFTPNLARQREWATLLKAKWGTVLASEHPERQLELRIKDEGRALILYLE